MLELMGLLMASAAQDAPNQTRSDQAEIDEIVVTASRREGSLRDVPSAVSAYSGEALDDAQLSTLGDLASTTPNLQIGSYQTNANVSIRGIGNTQTNAGSDPGVAIHVDGVYLGQAGLATSTFLDLERVEVLRGPQGTLFGRNATGGAINLIPNKPSETFEGGVRTSIGTGPTEVRTSGFVSGPLIGDGRLRGRLSVQQDYNEGYTRNIAPNDPERLDDRDTVSGRAQLSWHPSDAVVLRASIEHQRADHSGPSQFNLGTAALSGEQPPQLDGFSLGDLDGRRVGATEGFREVEATTAIFIAEADVGAGSLQALYSYADTAQDTLADTDGTEVFFATSGFTQRADQHFGEALFASDAANAFSIILGANFFQEDLSQDVSVPISTLPIAVDLGGDVDTTSYAVFGQAEYRLPSATTLFGGIRYTYDRKEIDEYNVFIGEAQQDASWDRITYELGLSHALTTNITGYMKYATGYKSGGFSAGSLGAPFDPETNENLEAGLKGRYFGGALDANVSVFHMKYDDLQVNQVVGVLAAITNAAAATINGAEAEIVARPTDGWRVNVSAAWLDATFDEFETEDSARPSLGVLDLSGNTLPQAPEASFSIGAFRDIVLSTGIVTAGARYDWRDRAYFNEFNLGVSSQDSFGKLDLHLRYETGDKRAFAGVYVQNATNETVISNTLVVSSLLGSIAIGSPDPGRQIGVTAGFNF